MEKKPELPLISVIISTYNKYDQLLVAINSVIEQSYKNIEIIIIDDDSSDIRYKTNLNLNLNLKN